MNENYARLNRAEQEIRSGDIDRFWEAFGPDGVHEVFGTYTLGALLAEQFVAELRSAIADQDAQAVGKKVIQLVWGVCLDDARRWEEEE